MSQAAQLAMAETTTKWCWRRSSTTSATCWVKAKPAWAAMVVSHERLGAEYLRRAGFGERMARLVEYHVEAKRYLTLRKPGYYDRLSEASRRTLGYQGG
jgi:hypothetical protein